MKTCLNCEKEFFPKRDRAKFCSDICRASFNQNTRNGKITVRIYSLINPLDQKVFYIGRTIGSLSKRLSEHLSDKTTGSKSKVINALKKENVKPIIEQVEEIKCTNETEEMEALKREEYWIKKYRSEGHPLINVIGIERDMNHRLVSGIIRDRYKTMPVGVRFDQEKLDLVKKNEGITSNQKVVDFLLHQYYLLFGPKEVSKFRGIEVKYAKVEKAEGMTVGKFEVEFNEDEFEDIPALTYNDYLTIIPKLETIEECQEVSSKIDASDFKDWQKINLKKMCVARSQHPDLN